MERMINICVLSIFLFTGVVFCGEVMAQQNPVAMQFADGRKVLFVRPYPLGIYGGSYTNNTESAITNIKARVSFFDANGTMIGRQLSYPTSVRAGPLGPGEIKYFYGRTVPLFTGKIDTLGVVGFKTSVEFFVDGATIATDKVVLQDFTASVLRPIWVEDVGQYVPQEVPTDNIVTRSEYDQLVEGMRRGEVDIIVGFAGEKVSETSGYNILLTMYKWVNNNGSSLIVMFSNGEMVSKSQFGLK